MDSASSQQPELSAAASLRAARRHPSASASMPFRPALAPVLSAVRRPPGANRSSGRPDGPPSRALYSTHQPGNTLPNSLKTKRRGTSYSTHFFGPFAPPSGLQIGRCLDLRAPLATRIKWDTALLDSAPISLKTNESAPQQVGHFCEFLNDGSPLRCFSSLPNMAVTNFMRLN